MLDSFKQNLGNFMNSPLLGNRSKKSILNKQNKVKTQNNNIAQSFLMKNEHAQQNINLPINTNFLSPNLNILPSRNINLLPPQNINKTSPQYINFPTPQNINILPLKNNDYRYTGLEAKVDSMNEKLSKLENRVEKDEKITLSTKDDIKDIKLNLDKNFNKLDNILEKLATKLK